MRNRFLRFAGVTVLVLCLAFVALAATPVSAHAAPADSGASQFCTANGDFGLSHGACVSYFESNGNSSAVFASECKTFLVPYGYFDTVGQCVSTLNQYLK